MNEEDDHKPYPDTFEGDDVFVPFAPLNLPDEELDWGEEEGSVNTNEILKINSKDTDKPSGEVTKQEEKVSKQKEVSKGTERSYPKNNLGVISRGIVESLKKEKVPINPVDSQETLSRSSASKCQGSKLEGKDKPDLVSSRRSISPSRDNRSRHNSHHSSHSYNSGRHPRSPPPRSYKRSPPRHRSRSRSPRGYRRSPYSRRSPNYRRSRSPLNYRRSRSPNYRRSRTPPKYRRSRSPGYYKRPPSPRDRRRTPPRGYRRSRSPSDRNYRSSPPYIKKESENHRVYRYDTEEDEMGKRKGKGKNRNYPYGNEPWRQKDLRNLLLYERRSKSPGNDLRHQINGHQSNAHASGDHYQPPPPPDNCHHGWSNNGGDHSNHNPGYRPTFIPDPRVRNQSGDPRINSGQQGPHPRPNYLPQRIPSQAEMTYRPPVVVNIHNQPQQQHSTWGYVYQPPPPPPPPPPPSDPRLNNRNTNSGVVRPLFNPKNANMVPVAAFDPRIPPSFNVTAPTNPSFGNRSNPQLLNRTNFPAKKKIESNHQYAKNSYPSRNYQVRQPAPRPSRPPAWPAPEETVPAKQRIAEKFDQRMVKIKAVDNEWARKEMEKESKRKEAVEEAMRKLENKNKPSPQQLDPNDIVWNVDSDSPQDVIDLDSPEYDRANRSPSLEEIPVVPSGSYAPRVPTPTPIDLLCIECGVKKRYKPKGMLMHNYCFECGKQIIAQKRAQEEYAKKVSARTAEENQRIHNEAVATAKRVAEKAKMQALRDEVYEARRRNVPRSIKKRIETGPKGTTTGKRGKRQNRARSRSLSPDKPGDVYNCNDKFPDVSTLEFDTIEVSKCWNCSHTLSSPSADVVLCNRCIKWNHNFHVDPEAYDDSEYRGECIFCDQLDILKNDRKKKLQPIPATPDIEDPDPEDAEDYPSGEPSSEWKYFWNYPKNDHNLKIADMVYVKRPGSEPDEYGKVNCDIWWINYIIEDAKGVPWFYAVNLRLPQDIIRDKNQLFYEREVFPCVGETAFDKYWFRIEEAIGRAVAIPRKEYFLGRPRGFKEKDVFLMHRLWDSGKGQEGDTISWTSDYFGYFPLNEENFTWKVFKVPVKVFKRNLEIEDGSYKEYYPKVKGDRFKKKQ